MSNDQKNLYESLIQEMILDGINGMTPELKELIQKSPVEKQRSMILTVLEENNVEHRLLCSKIQNAIADSNTTEATHIKGVVQMLREYVKVSATEVKTMGEVMTPIELVEEMLDTLPVDVWSNPKLRWLDPCNGVGTFMAVVVERLMNGLKTWEPDENKRYKHIIENMIYVCELQAKNMFLFMYAFDPKNDYALNVYNGSFLDEGFDNHMKMLGVEKFDVVVMNPPYNKNSNGVQQAGTLWDKFVIKTIDRLVDSGYLVAVHPDGWRNVDSKRQDVCNLLKGKQMLYLEVHDKGDGIKTFGVSTTYDFYCLKNTKNNGNFITKIKCMDGTTQRVDISKMKFIPNGMYKEFEKLLAKNGEEKVNLSLERYAYGTQKDYMSKEQTEEFKYPIAYLTYKDGSMKCWYSNTNKNGHFGASKVIFSNGISCPIVDKNGEYGMTEFTYAIIDEPKNLENIKKAMLNPEFLKLMSFSDGMTGVGRHRYNRKAISLFRKDFWVDFLDYDETKIAEEKTKKSNSKKAKMSS